MSTSETAENLVAPRNPLSYSASVGHLEHNNVLASKFRESLPIIVSSDDQPTSTPSTLSHFPDITNLNDDIVDEKTSEILTPSLSDSIEPSEVPDTPPEIKIELSDSEQVKQLNQSDSISNRPKPKEGAISVIDKAISETLTNVSAIRRLSNPNTVTRSHVKEFHPTSPDDPVFPVLRQLFIDSFNEFYKQIEIQLNLNPETNLIRWLDETFNDEIASTVSGEHRCFLLYNSESQDSVENILGFLTLKEENKESVYIAQVAVRLDNKRRGYGAQLLQHLRNVYPPSTYYWGLCRRANRPAVQFYLKHGAKFMKDDDVATKYGYDPTLYTGFEFVDNVTVVTPKSSAGFFTDSVVNNPEEPKAILTTQTHQEASTAADTRPVSKENKRKKRFGCCNLL